MMELERLSLFGVTGPLWTLWLLYWSFHISLTCSDQLSQSLILWLICLKLWYSVCVVLLLGCHTPLPHVPGSSGDIVIYLVVLWHDKSAWGRGCGEFPQLLVSWFEANGDSLLDPGMAVLIVDVEEPEGEDEEEGHHGQGRRWREKKNKTYL